MSTLVSVCLHQPLHTLLRKVCSLLDKVYQARGAYVWHIGHRLSHAGQVEIDQQVCQQLLQTRSFEQMSLDTDEVRMGAAQGRCMDTLHK